MLKKSTLLLLSIFVFTCSFAQQTHNVIFFAKDGEKFSVVLNGVKQNDIPRANVKITDLNAANYEATVVFQNPALGEFKKMLMMPEVSSELTMRIVKNKKGKYVMRYFGEVPLANAPSSAGNQYVVSYAPIPRPRREPNPSFQSTTTTTETITTQSTETGNETMGGSININVDGSSVGIDVKVKDPTMETDANVTSSTTFTRTTTTTTHSGFDNFDDGDDMDQPQRDDHYHMPGYNGRIGCSWPIESASFVDIKRSIVQKDFEDSKLTLAKQVLQSNCLLASQVRDIMRLFDYEDSRLQFAKLAYGHTYDQGNFYKLNDAFDYELSIDELNEYISSQD